MEALIAAYEAENANTSRRMLADGDLTIEQIRALLGEANGAAEAANAEAAAAAAEAQAKADEVAAANKKKQDAYTTKPVIAGAISSEDRIKAAYKAYSELKIQLGKNPEDLDLQYKVSYLWTRYNKIKEALAKADQEQKEANPEAAKAAEAALARAKRDAEKAAALPAAEKLALLQELEVAMNGENPDEDVPALLRREGKAVELAVKAQKEAARDRKKTDVEKTAAASLAQRAQKRYLAIKEQVKMEEDKKAAALVIA